MEVNLPWIVGGAAVAIVLARVHHHYGLPYLWHRLSCGDCFKRYRFPHLPGEVYQTGICPTGSSLRKR